jgi:asparagine synthase (glutamine-hydrolysing)
MCGIAGLALRPDAPPPDPAVVLALARALGHRGPDGAGSVVVGQTVLVHTRLAIVDLAGGDQPFRAGPATLIANGEIYNAPELRAAMPGTPFATLSDCEPPLHLFCRDGGGFAAELRGMFAIAVHDRVGHTVTLTRDPFGIKPLYFVQMPDGVAFASEPQALLTAGLCARGVREAARAELLQMQFCSGAETIFPGIHRVLPGETLRITDGRLTDRSRIAALRGAGRAGARALKNAGADDVGEDAALARLDAALMQSVELHQRSDVPYGMFLSGGVDSAVILAAMARLNDRPVLAFTAGFDVPGAADEREQAARLARSVGAHHETLEITRAMVWRHLPQIVAAMDDPAADYAIIPSWFLAQRARQDVKVVLCGEGGDEIFGGYGRYRSAMRPWFLGGRAMRARGSFDGLGVLRALPAGWRDGLSAAEAQAGGPQGGEAGRSRLQIAQATDMTDWLPHDLLLKLDRCLMAHGVEGRTPFLDPAVAEAGFYLPDTLKIRHGRGKYLLRLWLQDAMPAARPFAPKQGFSVPIGAWIAEDGARLGPLVAARPCVAAIALPGKVERLFKAASGKREGMAAWMLLFYALWHRAHVEARACDCDIWEALG